MYPVITRDPFSGRELIVTRLESPDSGAVIEGRFTLGWISKLTPEQIDFVGLLLRYRTNVQRLATELGVAYNTVRSRLDEVVDALGGPPERPQPPVPREERADVLRALAAGEIAFDEAMSRLGGT